MQEQKTSEPNKPASMVMEATALLHPKPFCMHGQISSNTMALFAALFFRVHLISIGPAECNVRNNRAGVLRLLMLVVEVFRCKD